MNIQFTFFCFAFCISIIAELSSENHEFFESKIRPLLVEHCYKCHASDSKKIKGGLLLDSAWGWKQGGDSGEVILPGHPEKSLLMEMVEHHPDVEAMPPKYKLKAHEIEAFRTWIEKGAPDPRVNVQKVARKKSYELEERLKWWSLQPIKTITKPIVKDSKWPKGQIDHFILHELEKKNWKPAEKADKRTLLRRLSYDLIGLPPSIQEQEDFLKDASSDAYEKIVDHLLQSPRFGEHWARKWMDLMRYAETKAFENDYTMPHAYKYRDYLIKVFNDNVPYNQFVLESLAGDLMESPRISESGHNESLKGPGFFYLTPGHHGPPDLHGDEVRVFDNMIDVIGKSFLATTISCARCHDHKFDAVSIKNFYSLYGILASSRLDFRNTLQVAQADLEPLINTKKELKKALIQQWKLDLDKFEQALKTSSKEDLIKKFSSFKKYNKPNYALYPLYVLIHQANKFPVALKAMQEQAPEKLKSIGNLNVDGIGDWLVSGQAFSKETVSSGEFIVASDSKTVLQSLVGKSMVAGHLTSRMDGSLKSPTFILDDKGLRVRVKGKGVKVNLMVHHYELVGKGPTTNVLSKKIDSHDWVWIEFPSKLWKGSRAYLDIQLNSLANEFSRNGQHVYRHDDQAYVAIDQVLMGEDRQKVTPASFWGELSHHSDIFSSLRALLNLWEKNQTSLEQEEILNGLLELNVLSNKKNMSKDVANLIHIYKQHNQSLALPNYVRTLMDGHGEDEPVYIRGLHTKVSDEKNPRHFLDAIDARAFQVVGSGRLEWAKRVVDKSNPLTSRVIVNRLWHHIFGRGLVASVDDFGKMGDLPSHPELLDDLAYRFMKNNWSIKSMLKELVMSQTYQMSSRPSLASQNEDPNNQFLQHMSVRRLEAEAIRDTILHASSEIKHELYGASVPVNLHDTPSSRSKPKKSGPLNGEGRRSVYLELRKNYLPHFLVSFDMPASSAPFGRRSVTNVPAQSLTLLNDPFVHEQAEHWAKKLLGMKLNQDELIHHMHEHLLGRPATSAEISWAKSSLQTFREQSDDLAAWKGLCHVMFNRKEMIYKF